MKKHLALLVFLVSIGFMLGAIISFGGLDPSNYKLPANQPYITPAPYTFGIWGVIYAWLLIATGIGYFKYRDDTSFDPMRMWLLASMFIGIFWQPSNTINPWLSLVIIIGMWITACMAMLNAPKTHPGIGLYPTGLYAGWLTAAIGVSLGTILIGQGMLTNLSGSILGLLVAAIAAIIWITKVPAAITYSLAVVWGLVGIIMFNVLGQDGSYVIVLLASLGAVVIALLGVTMFNRVQNQ